MQTRTVIEVRAENYEEEQFLLTRFPRTAWIRLGEQTRFYISNEKAGEVAKVITEWKGAKNE